MKQSTTSSSSAGIAVDSEESKAIDDVAEVIEKPAEDITLNLDSEELHYHILIAVLYRTLFIVIKRCLVCVHIVREFY